MEVTRRKKSGVVLSASQKCVHGNTLHVENTLVEGELLFNHRDIVLNYITILYY